MWTFNSGNDKLMGDFLIPYKRETPAFECKRFANQYSVSGGH